MDNKNPTTDFTGVWGINLCVLTNSSVGNYILPAYGETNFSV